MSLPAFTRFKSKFKIVTDMHFNALSEVLNISIDVSTVRDNCRLRYIKNKNAHDTNNMNTSICINDNRDFVCRFSKLAYFT